MQWIWVQKKANWMYSFSFSLFNYIAKQLKINDCNHSEWIFTAYVRDFDILVNVENSTEKNNRRKNPRPKVTTFFGVFAYKRTSMNSMNKYVRISLPISWNYYYMFVHRKYKILLATVIELNCEISAEMYWKMSNR